ncbi:DUF3310 domain-containing protein [Paraglaciecola chathamensis]|uniref:DUF3310 domain-containing protein n=1 Tax=Paraglaciecola chathamensis TaxID=368405 RepID=UPI00364119E7
MTKPYYENEHGVDFLDYLAAEVFTKKEMKVIAKFNALKYEARAGLKPGVPLTDDLAKRNTYFGLYQKQDENYPLGHLIEDTKVIVDNFKIYKGK